MGGMMVRTEEKYVMSAKNKIQKLSTVILSSDTYPSTAHGTAESIRAFGITRFFTGKGAESPHTPGSTGIGYQ
ncbi:hypothetical protein QTO34_009397 [Cnephaeus nilssonii]|uniref:Uncharacterized protein n=1 Tax=Cnephaeus nilssonii TaxID=3371016 RepID=A0AA40LGJ0_CNENI|nr:hypothetical protein QTO34_009397 [Eptesicus nilssonii]